MKTLLCLDSSTGPSSIAIVREGEAVATQVDSEANQQSRRLVSATDALLRNTLGNYDAVDAVVVTTGPGGFTGIRVALAAARGFALACNVPLIGIPTLHSYAWQVLHNAAIGNRANIAINAWREQVYMQEFVRTDRGVTPLCEAQAVDLATAKPAIIGNMEGLVPLPVAPHAKYAGLLVHFLLDSGAELDKLAQEFPTEAFYIRNPDAKPQSSFLERHI